MYTTTLRIKRKYFDAILAGTKRIEYRDVKPYYTNLLESRQVNALKLHYQSDRKLLVKVKRIEIIPCPPTLKNFSSHVYAIHLGKSKLI